MRPMKDNDDANTALECDEEELMTDMAIAEEAEARYREHGITGTRPYNEYRADRLESAE